jgi:thiol-disulfide isomerase/thioredoxin
MFSVAGWPAASGIASPAGNSATTSSAGSDFFAIGGFRTLSFAEGASPGSPAAVTGAPATARAAPTVQPSPAAAPAAPAEPATVTTPAPEAASSVISRLRDLASWPPSTASASPLVAPSTPDAAPAVEERRLVVASADRPVVRPDLAEGRAVAPPQPVAPAPASQVTAPGPDAKPVKSAPAATPERKAEPVPEPRAVEFHAWSPMPAPKLEFDNLDGTRIDPASLRGKRVILNFWAVWCVPCREEIPALQRLADTMKGQGVEIVLVNLGDSREAIERFLQRVPTRLRIVRVRGDVPRAGDWNVTALPATVLVDPAGMPRWRAVGRIDGKASEALLLKRLAEIGRPR